MSIELFGLLHLDRHQTTAMNLDTTSFRHQVATYVDNATLLARTLAGHGLPFTLLTNDGALIDQCRTSPDRDLPFTVVEIPFPTTVPSGIRFYSAHHKFDAFRHLASLDRPYVALCDLDMVCINGLSPSFLTLIEQGIPVHYDITAQVSPSVGRHAMVRDLIVVGTPPPEFRWSGGEFVSGTPDFFGRLIHQIDAVYPRYLSNLETIRHLGDEVVTSTAIERLRRAGVEPADAGELGIVGRFWNARVAHRQPPFRDFERCSLLHLPADKALLAEFAGQHDDALLDFCDLYRSRAFSLRGRADRELASLARLLRRPPQNRVRRLVRRNLQLPNRRPSSRRP